MIFSQSQKPQSHESSNLSSSLLRIISLLLEGCALHAVELDSEEHSNFRRSIRDIERRLEQAKYPDDLLILAGEANKTLQSYGQSVEKYIRVLTTEKHLAIKLLSESLLRVCNTSEQSAQALRGIEGDLNKAFQIDDVRALRGKLAEVVDGLCKEAERQEQQYRDLKDRVSESTANAAGPHDQVTGLPTLKHAEARIAELAASGHPGFVIAFFLKNVDVVNRRFGFDAGDKVLQRFAKYLGKNLSGNDQLFRWRGPCFVVAAERFDAIELVKAEADRVASRGPEQEVESEGKSMVFRLTAATRVFLVTKNNDVVDLSNKLDRFAAEQFKESPGAR